MAMATQQEATTLVLNNLTPHSSDGFYATNNQFLKNGTKGFTEWKILKEDLYIRLDFPGVSKKDFKFSIDQEKRLVIFEGEAPQESPHEGGGRTYFCNIFRLVCECCLLSSVKVDVKDGVARIILQKVKDNNYKGSDGCAKAEARLSPVGKTILNGLLSRQISTISDASTGQFIEEHPYVTKGSRKAFESKITADGELFLRVDMPGVAKRDVKVFLRGGEVRFFGKAKKKLHDSDGRGYMGSVSLLPKTFLKGKIQHEMKNGVLRMVIPPA